MKKLALVLLFGLMAQTASAKTIFSCFMKNGKHLSVEQVGQNYHYSYGKPGKPEMMFLNHKDNVTEFSTQNENILLMTNKGIEYMIARNRHDGAALIIVNKNGKELANTMCSNKREINGLEG